MQNVYNLEFNIIVVFCIIVVPTKMNFLDKRFHIVDPESTVQATMEAAYDINFLKCKETSTDQIFSYLK